MQSKLTRAQYVLVLGTFAGVTTVASKIFGVSPHHFPRMRERARFAPRAALVLTVGLLLLGGPFVFFSLLAKPPSHSLPTYPLVAATPPALGGEQERVVASPRAGSASDPASSRVASSADAISPVRAPPGEIRVYMYEELWNERCLGPFDYYDSTTLCMREALKNHPWRVRDPNLATVFYIPFNMRASYSAAWCDGQWHHERVQHVLDVLRNSTYFQRHKVRARCGRERHFLNSPTTGPRPFLGHPLLAGIPP